MSFDQRIKVVFKINGLPDGYLEILYWLDQHSQGTVDVKIENSYGYEAIYIGFEDQNDSLMFKIKYGSEFEIKTEIMEMATNELQ